MPEIGFSYDAHTEPSPVKLSVALGASGTTLNARLLGLDHFVCVLKPSGNVAEEIVSGAATPLAQTLGVILPQAAKEIIDRVGPIPLVDIGAYSQTVGGEKLTINASNLRVSTWNGMLKLDAEVSVA